MKFKIGQKVLYNGEEWEIFRYESQGKYFIWNRDTRMSKEVREDEVIGL